LWSSLGKRVGTVVCAALTCRIAARLVAEPQPCQRHGSQVCSGSCVTSIAGPNGAAQTVLPFGCGHQVADPKPPRAAVAKIHGRERRGKAGAMIPAGMIERGERKRTASEASKAMSKPRGDPSCGISSEDALIPTERHPACRQREARSGSGMDVRTCRRCQEKRRKRLTPRGRKS
jgi:hypothetical protein